MADAKYFLKETTLTPPVFFGQGAERLGIAGLRIDTKEGHRVYLNLFDGYATDGNGERDAKLPKYMHPERRGAFQIVTNDPKDVSIAGEVAGDTRIESVRLKAREAVARYVEENAQVKVTKKAEIAQSDAKVKGWKRPERKSGNLVMAWFDHAGSREGDPARHGHLVVFNLSEDKKEGIWKAVELRYVDRPTLSKIYRDTMRQGLNELGYKTKRVGNEYEIVGVPAEVKAEFSRRRTSISAKNADYEEFNGKKASPKAKHRAGLYDRPEKPDNMPLEDRRKGWLARMTGAQRSAVASVVSKARHSVKASRWRKGVHNCVAKLRRIGMVRTSDSVDRNRNHGYSR